MSPDLRERAGWPEDLVLPDHDGHTLAALLPGVGGLLTGGGGPHLDLPRAERYVVVLVDGMGRRLLDDHESLAPHLSRMERSDVLTCAVPSTTATSLTSLGTGLAPGSHGILGYTFRSPEGVVMNALSWANGGVPEQLQPRPTAFQALAAAGIEVTSVGPARFERSGLTRAGLRGPRFVPVRDEEDIDLRTDLVAQAARTDGPSLTYVYERSLDHVGHGQGCRSAAWRRQLSWVDELVEALAESLEPGTALVVTADHGMVDVPHERFILAEDEAGLLADVDDLAGEPRLRQVYTARPEDVARRWRATLSDRAVVLTAGEALDAGLLGDWDPAMRPRLGDVLALMRQDHAVMTRRMPQELGLVGMHGSLTADEMLIPLRHEIVGSR